MVCAYTRVTFGDQAAALLLEVAKRRAAKEGSHIDPKAAIQIKGKTYVDDGVCGGTRDEAQRMKGELKDGKYTGTIPKIHSQCGMEVKFMATSGDPDPMAAEPLGGKVLGLSYDLGEDKIHYQPQVTIQGSQGPKGP